jgi:hypothetical protein
MNTARIILLLLVWQTGFSQWNDNFEDGDFSNDPSWTGDTADFNVENNTLRLSAPAVSGQSYLSTPSENINDGSWQFSVRLDFNPSSSNYAKIYLVSSNSNLKETLDGYFIKLGGSSDVVSLYRQDGLAAEEIINGTNGRLSLAVVNVQVLVNRSAEGAWQLSSKLDAEEDWYTEGSIIDQSYNQSSFFGISCIYTSSRSTKFFFDNISLSGEPYTDLTPPLVDSVYTSGSGKVAINFKEPISQSSALIMANYFLGDLVHPISVAPSTNSIELEFDNPLEVINNLSISGVEDLAGNTMLDTLVQFIYVASQPAVYGDIIFNEIMADPSPREDLPEIEYVEIHNVSDRAINMTEWSFRDKISSTFFSNATILPDSFLILCNKADADLMRPFGNVIGLSPWPSLNNSGDSLTLLNGQEELIDVVMYEKGWYRNIDKEDGGWSIERINPKHGCSGYLNWRASTSVLGGTPGKRNTVLSTEDIDPPAIMNFSVALDSLIITFDKPITANLGTISITPANSVMQTIVNYNQLYIVANEPFVSEQTNEVVITSIADCFDNVSQPLSISFIPDFKSAEIDTVYSEYPNMLEIYFSEHIQTPNGEDFEIDILGSPASIEHDPDDQSHLTLVYDKNLIYEENYTIITNRIVDLYSNMTEWSQYTFIYRPLSYPQFAEIIISEIMADPTPSVNLPEDEYLELLNRTSKRLLLKDLILADVKDKVKIPHGIIEPYERVILTKTTASEAFSEYARSFGIPNWPTLNNAGDQIMILDTSLQVIHHVNYTNDWYDNDEKKGGGWSLELIDETNFCSGNKGWTSSNGLLGGTPGSINSMQSNLPDMTVPNITEAFAITADSILIRFDEGLTNFLPEIAISNLLVIDYFYTNYSQDELLINVASMQPRIRYEISVARIIDCAGNINDEEMASIFLPEIAGDDDIILSEILFNPRNEGVDFIEIYNNSAKYISLLNWQLSNGPSITNISATRILAPYSFRVFTTLPVSILEEYPNADGEKIFKQEIPAMPNERGSVVLFNDQQHEQDGVNYDEAWHFPYLASVDGISLERINFTYPANLSSNWASAAAFENYATPGYQNSQAGSEKNKAVLSVSPQVIVPDANGRDDFTTIILDQPGSMASITIYNLQGQIIKQLANNALVGNSSIFTWDGTDNSGAIVSLGHYIVVANIISTSGTTQTIREKVVVGTGF